MLPRLLPWALLAALNACGAGESSRDPAGKVAIGQYELAYIAEGNTPPYLNQSEIWVANLSGEPARIYRAQEGFRLGSMAKLPAQDALLLWIYDHQGDPARRGRLHRLDYDGTLTALSAEHEGTFVTIDGTDADHLVVTTPNDSFALVRGVEHPMVVAGKDLFISQDNEYLYGVRAPPNDQPGIVRWPVDRLPAGDWETWELVQQVDTATMEGDIGFDLHPCRGGDLIAFEVNRKVNTDGPHADIYLKRPGQPAERLAGDPAVDDRYPVLSPDCSMVAWSAAEQTGGRSSIGYQSLLADGRSGNIDAPAKNWLLDRSGSVGAGFTADGRRLAFHAGQAAAGSFLGVYDFATAALTRVVETNDDWHYHHPVWLR